MSFTLKNLNSTLPNYLLQFDGGANPNPGPCAGSFVIYDQAKQIVFEGGKFLSNGTNNIGEYTGLLEGIKCCLENGIKNISVEGDSKLVVQQVAKQWNVNQSHLKIYCQEIQDLIKKFDYFDIRHVYRENNKKADALSDETLDKKTSWIRF